MSVPPPNYHRQSSASNHPSLALNALNSYKGNEFDGILSIKTPFSDQSQAFLDSESQKSLSNGETFLLQLLQKNQKPPGQQDIPNQIRRQSSQQSDRFIQETKDALIEKLRFDLIEANKIIVKQKEEISVLKAQIAQHSQEKFNNLQIIEKLQLPNKNNNQNGFTEGEMNNSEPTTPILSLMCSDVFQAAEGIIGADAADIDSIMNLSPIKKKSSKQQDRSTFCDRSCIQDIMKIPDTCDNQSNQQLKQPIQSLKQLASQNSEDEDDLNERESVNIPQDERTKLSNQKDIQGDSNSGGVPNKKSKQILAKSSSDSCKVKDGKVTNNQGHHQNQQNQQSTDAFIVTSSTRTRSSNYGKPKIMLDAIEPMIVDTMLIRSQTTKNPSTNSSCSTKPRFTFNFNEEYIQNQNPPRQSSLNGATSPSITTLYCDFLRKGVTENMPSNSDPAQMYSQQQQQNQQLPKQKRSTKDMLRNSSLHQQFEQPSHQDLHHLNRAHYSGDLELQDALYMNSAARCHTDQQLSGYCQPSSYVIQQGNSSAQRTRMNKETPLKTSSTAQRQQHQQVEDSTRSSLNLFSLQQSNSYHIHPKKYIETKHENLHLQIPNEFQFPLSTSSQQSRNMRPYNQSSSKRSEFMLGNGPTSVGMVVSPQANNQIKMHFVESTRKSTVDDKSVPTVVSDQRSAKRITQQQQQQQSLPLPQQRLVFAESRLSVGNPLYGNYMQPRHDDSSQMSYDKQNKVPANENMPTMGKSGRTISATGATNQSKSSHRNKTVNDENYEQIEYQQMYHHHPTSSSSSRYLPAESFEKQVLRESTNLIRASNNNQRNSSETMAMLVGQQSYQKAWPSQRKQLEHHNAQIPFRK